VAGQERGETRRKSASFAYPFLSARVGLEDEDRLEKDKVHPDITCRTAGLQEKVETQMKGMIQPIPSPLTTAFDRPMIPIA
jgi:hypothetical protein